MDAPRRQLTIVVDDLDVTSFEIRSDGYNAYAVIGALVFGFSITLIIESDVNTLFGDDRILFALFSICMTIATTLSAAGFKHFIFFLFFFFLVLYAAFCFF